MGEFCAMLRLNGEHNFYSPTGDCLQCGAHYKDVIAELQELEQAAKALWPLIDFADGVGLMFVPETAETAAALAALCEALAALNPPTPQAPSHICDVTFQPDGSIGCSSCWRPA